MLQPLNINTSFTVDVSGFSFETRARRHNAQVHTAHDFSETFFKDIRGLKPQQAWNPNNPVQLCANKPGKFKINKQQIQQQQQPLLPEVIQAQQQLPCTISVYKRRTLYRLLSELFSRNLRRTYVTTPPAAKQQQRLKHHSTEIT